MNRICRLEVRDRLIDPNSPEVWISVVPERSTPTTEVRGRLMGPRCLYSSTVEVAYPLRPFHDMPDGLDGLSRRVIIPEASFWDPVSPFLYQGPVELWEEGQLCDQTTLTHGLRTLGLGGKGLRINGKPFTIRGVTRASCSEEEALELRRLGFNTILTDVAPQALSLWEMADRVGFLVLGRVAARGDALEQALALRRHPSCLGWLFYAALYSDHACKPAVELLLQKSRSLAVGIAVPEDGLTPETWATCSGKRMDFVVCPKSALPALPDLPAKLIALTDTSRNGHDDDDAAAGILGTIQP